MKPYAALLILLFASCYSAPVLTHSDTTQSQEIARQAAQGLTNTLSNNQNVISPGDQASIIAAQRALSACAISQSKLSEQVNTCGRALEECKAAYVHSQESGGSLWSKAKALWREMLAVGVSFILGTLIGRAVLSMLWGAIKGALHIS